MYQKLISYRRHLFALLAIALVIDCSDAQQFLAPGGSIRDYQDTYQIDTFPIQVSGLPNVANTSFGLARICINLSHPRVSDLKIALQNPSGASIWLTNRNGGDDGSGYDHCCFSSRGFNGYIHQGNAPFTGEYIPDGRLVFLNNNTNPNGTWKLLVQDLKMQQIGQLHLVSLQFGVNPTPNIHAPPCNTTNPTDCVCDDAGSTDCRLLPDLIILEQFTKQQIKEYAWNDPDYPAQLRFAATIANVGDGPLETRGREEWFCGEKPTDDLRPCPDGQYPRQRIYQRIYHLQEDKMQYEDVPSGTNYFDDQPGHDHYHVDDWVEFRLVKTTTDTSEKQQRILVAQAHKVSYCLWDTGTCHSRDSLCNWGEQMYSEQNLPNYGLGNYTSCKGDKQGISVGGYDTYGMFYEGQYIDLPPNLPNGVYTLEIEIDPHGQYLEKNKSNNIFSMPVYIQKQERQ